MQVGAGPPFRNPLSSGTSGAPSAPPFGPGCRAGRSREDGLRRPGEALASGHSGFPFIASWCRQAWAAERQLKFGLFYQLQIPKPYAAESWDPDAERRIYRQMLEQVELA